MIVWGSKLYIGEQIGKKALGIQKKLSAGKFVPDIYLIAKPTNEENLFDVFPSKELLFPYHKRREIVVYGLAKGKEEALGLVADMVEEMYRETGGLCSKEYFAEE